MLVIWAALTQAPSPELVTAKAVANVAQGTPGAEAIEAPLTFLRVKTSIEGFFGGIVWKIVENAPGVLLVLCILGVGAFAILGKK